MAFWHVVVFENSSAQKATCPPPLAKRACLQGRNDEQLNEASPISGAHATQLQAYQAYQIKGVSPLAIVR